MIIPPEVVLIFLVFFFFGCGGYTYNGKGIPSIYKSEKPIQRLIIVFTSSAFLTMVPLFGYEGWDFLVEKFGFEGAIFFSFIFLT